MVKQPKVLCLACDTANDPDEGVCQRCGLSLAAIEPDGRERKIICPRCQNTNNAGSFFCYTCGKYFADIDEAKTGRRSNKRGKGAPLRPAPKAKVIMPGGAEITLTGAPVFIERSDFDSTLPHDILMRISRQHILITYGRGKYYLNDYGREGKGSTNHTRLNGIDMHNKRKKALKDGDKIELAGQSELTMTFRLLQEPK
ncbi:MAG: FHA domain-containing protein [Planctomycetota bacterium]